MINPDFLLNATAENFNALGIGRGQPSTLVWIESRGIVQSARLHVSKFVASDTIILQ